MYEGDWGMSTRSQQLFEDVCVLHRWHEFRGWEVKIAWISYFSEMAFDLEKGYLSICFCCFGGLRMWDFCRSGFFIQMSVSTVSQPWHYLHLGPDNSLLWGAVLGIVVCLAASLVSTYLIPLAPPPPQCLQTLPYVLWEWGAQLSAVESHSFIVRRWKDRYFVWIRLILT